MDCHAHFLSPALFTALPGLEKAEIDGGVRLVFDGRPIGPVPDRLTSFESLMSTMDAAALTHSVLCSTSWFTCYWADPKRTQALHRAANETLAETVRSEPGRLRALASLPMQQVDLAMAELEYALDELGMVGACLGTSVNGTYYNDPAFTPFLEMASELRVPLFIHPDDVAGYDRVKDFGLRYLVGNSHESMLSFLHLALSGVLDRFPDLQVCFTLGGGSLPYLIGRIDHGWAVRPESRVATSRPPSTYLSQCYFDTIVHSAPAFRRLAETVPSSQLLLGSDYPWRMGTAEPRRLIEEDPGYGPLDRAAVLSGNAARLLSRSGWLLEDAAATASLEAEDAASA